MRQQLSNMFSTIIQVIFIGVPPIVAGSQDILMWFMVRWRMAQHPS